MRDPIFDLPQCMYHASPRIAVEQLLCKFGIGLTGGIASGKSTAAESLRRRGYDVFDADVIARKAQQSPDIVSGVAQHFQTTFKQNILTIDAHGNQALDRKLLRHCVAKDKSFKNALESVMHPLIRAQLFEGIAAASLLERPRIFFYEAALIIDTGQTHAFREVWLVDCEPATQIQRLLKRSPDLTREDAEKLVAAQFDRQLRLVGANLMISSEGSLEQFESRLESAVRELL